MNHVNSDFDLFRKRESYLLIMEEFQKRIGICQNHLSQTKRQCFDVKGWEEEVYNLWLKEFHHPDFTICEKNTSKSDILFVLLCYIRCCKNPDLLHLSNANTLPDLTTQLRILCCKHTLETLKYYPTHEELQCLWDQCASYIVNGDSGSQCITPTDEILLQKVKSLHLEAPIPKNETEKEKETRLEMKKRRQEEGTINHLGLLWNTNTCNMFHFITLTSRVFYYFELQKHIFEKYRLLHYPEIKYKTYHKLAFLKWIEECDQYNDEEFWISNFRRLSYEYIMPIGAMDHNKRTIKTLDDIILAQNAIEEQLGIDTTLAIIEQMKIKIYDIDEDHLTYEMKLLQTIEKYFFTDFLYDFISQHILISNRLSQYHFIIDKVIEDYQPPRRPMIINLFGKWFIHSLLDKEIGWLECEDFIDAFLKWCVIIRKYFQDTLITKKIQWVSITKFLNIILKHQ